MWRTEERAVEAPQATTIKQAALCMHAPAPTHLNASARAYSFSGVNIVAVVGGSEPITMDRILYPDRAPTSIE